MIAMSLPVDRSFSFYDPLAAPLRSIDSIAADPMLIVAPHPDDETLGCGGAIALLRAAGYAVQVLVMSDGTLSHPRSVRYPALRLRVLRERETLEALSVLGVSQTETSFFRFQDGSVPNSESSEFQEAVNRCHKFLQTLKPKTIFLPWRFDPHPDHRSTWQLIHTAVVTLDYLPRVIEYPIWDWDMTQRGDQLERGRFSGWRLDIGSVLETKQNAIAAYRSQITDLIDDDPAGFRLTPEMLKNFAHPWELYLEER